MKIYIMVDMEGISGIINNDQVEPGAKYYDSEGRQYATWDTNACIQGCFDGGATDVIVKDAHGTGKNFIWSELDQSARYVTGDSGDSHDWRMPGIEACDGLILLGYHAMAGTPEAVLEHTWTAAWQNLQVNGKPSGEIAMDTYYAAHFGVPTIMVSGDDKACGEALSLVPGIVTAQVKKAHTLYGATLLSKNAAHTLIREKAAEAVRCCKEKKTMHLETPVTIRLELTERTSVPSEKDRPYCRIVGPRTFEVVGDHFAEAFTRLMIAD